jgi:SAM-dependent methyltransferase
VKLNLGCGDDYQEGYVNVDLRDDVGDVHCDVRHLPFEDGAADEVLAFDILEHLPPSDSLPCLREWRRVLREGGELKLKVPNMLALAAMIIEDDRPAMAIRNIYGGHRWGPDGAWDAHHTGWTPKMLHLLLESEGFEVESNDLELNMTVVAKKGQRVVAPQDYKTVGVMKKTKTTVKEAQLEKDRAAYKRLRQQGLQPPRIDGCAKLESEAVTRDEIVMGVVPTHLDPAARKKQAKERRDAFERAKELAGESA